MSVRSGTGKVTAGRVLAIAALTDNYDIVEHLLDIKVKSMRLMGGPQTAREVILAE
jgi:hypothetical protein